MGQISLDQFGGLSVVDVLLMVCNQGLKKCSQGSKTLNHSEFYLIFAHTVCYSM